MAAPKGNKNAIGNNGGRPPFFNTPEELEDRVRDFFETMKEGKLWPTICGLALHLGFCDRQSLYDYEKKVEFSGIIKKARLMVEMSYEQRLGNQSCAGAIFALKNMGWRDKQEHDHTLNVTGFRIHRVKADKIETDASG